MNKEKKINKDKYDTNNHSNESDEWWENIYQTVMPVLAFALLVLVVITRTK